MLCCAVLFYAVLSCSGALLFAVLSRRSEPENCYLRYLHTQSRALTANSSAPVLQNAEILSIAVLQTFTLYMHTSYVIQNPKALEHC